MKKVNNSTKLYIFEGYVPEEGWQEIEQYKTVEEIKEMFAAGEYSTLNLSEKKSDFIGKDFNKNTFRDEYLTLEGLFDKLVDEALFQIQYGRGIEINAEYIKSRIELVSSISGNVIGYYYSDLERIEIRMSYIKELLNDTELAHTRAYEREFQGRVRTIVHEIGHYLHDVLFDNKDMNLPTEHKSSYARTNECEDFAEAFMDYVVPSKVNTMKRDLAIAKLVGGRI